MIQIGTEDIGEQQRGDGQNETDRQNRLRPAVAQAAEAAPRAPDQVPESGYGKSFAANRLLAVTANPRCGSALPAI